MQPIVSRKILYQLYQLMGRKNIICLAKYARFFLGKDNTTEQELKHVYVALSRIVSTTALEGSRFFGHLIPEIKQGISLCDFSSQAFEVLESLKNIYLDSELDIEYLLEEITLCQADLVRSGRKGGMSMAKMAKLKVKKQLYELVRYFCSMILNNQFDNKLFETTCVAFWFHVWTVLFRLDDVILVDIGELTSKATKYKVEKIFCGKYHTNKDAYLSKLLIHLKLSLLIKDIMERNQDVAGRFDETIDSAIPKDEQAHHHLKLHTTPKVAVSGVKHIKSMGSK